MISMLAIITGILVGFSAGMFVMALCNMASPKWVQAGVMSRREVLLKLCELDRSAHRWECRESSLYAASDAGGAFACGNVVGLWDYAGGISNDRYDMAAKAAYELAHWEP